MVHTLDPVLIPIYGNIAIRYYGLAYLVGFIAAYFLVNWLVQRKGLGWSKEMMADAVTYSAFGVLVGGRVGYALFYSPDLFIRFRSEPPFWGLLAVNEGGMASHGGIIGLVVGLYLFARKYKVSSLVLFDFAAISGPIGIFFGRIANFINGELYGRPAPADLPWGVKFPTEIETWVGTEPQKLKGLGPVVSKLSESWGSQWETWVQGFLTTGQYRQQIYGVLQEIVLATQKGQMAVVEALAPLLTLRHPSQIYQALLEGLTVFLIVFFASARERRPGMVGCVFLVSYAVARIIGEEFRTPDAHIGFDAFGLTRGQWLSVVMAVLGLGIAFYLHRFSQTFVPGWWKPKSIRVHRKYQ